MPDVDAKTKALLDEGLTQGEVDYLTSGGKKTEGLTPPAEGDAAATPAEPEKPAQAAEPEKPAQAEPAKPAAEPIEEDDPEPAKDSPFYPQWKREKTRRQELQRELKARDDSIAAERATTQAERERWARLDERLRVFQQAVEPEPAKPATPPDPESDPFGYMRWLGEQVTGLAGRTDQVTTSVQERDAAIELRDMYLEDARSFATRQPDFGGPQGAYKWLMANRDAELQAAGYTDPAERTRIINLDERDIVARALTARQTNPNAAGPAQIIYGLAKARGFQTPAPQQGNGAARPGNGAAAQPPPATAAPPAPSVTQQVEAIQRGQAASRSLSSAGGAPAPTGIDLAKLADMDDGEYLAWKSALTAPQRKELASLLGAPGR